MSIKSLQGRRVSIMHCFLDSIIPWLVYELGAYVIASNLELDLSSDKTVEKDNSQ